MLYVYIGVPLRKVRDYFTAIMSIVTVLIQRNIHRYRDELYSIDVSIKELMTVRGDLSRIELLLSDHNDGAWNVNNEIYIHTLERLHQSIDDCLIRMHLTKENLMKDKYIAVKTIRKLDVEVKCGLY
ncbi:hypothetical protein D3C87_1522870 [compost metagenome]